MELGEGFSVPNWLKVDQFGERSGWGEDNPVWFERLERDGWVLVNASTCEKPHPRFPNRYTLRMSILGLKEDQGPWHRIEHSLIDHAGDESASLGRSDWADWSDTGDLLFAKSGRLYRLRLASKKLPPLNEAIALADFSNRQFTERKAPPEALRWPKKLRET